MSRDPSARAAAHQAKADAYRAKAARVETLAESELARRSDEARRALLRLLPLLFFEEAKKYRAELDRSVLALELVIRDEVARRAAVKDKPQ